MDKKSIKLSTRLKSRADKAQTFVRKIIQQGDFPGSPVVKTLPSNVESAGLIPGWGTKITHDSWPKKSTHKIEETL